MLSLGTAEEKEETCTAELQWGEIHKTTKPVPKTLTKPGTVESVEPFQILG